jgi:hypothetical protein
MKNTERKEGYIELFTRNNRNRIAWIEIGIWEVRGLRRRMDKRSCPMCLNFFFIFFLNLHSEGWNQGPLDTAAT